MLSYPIHGHYPTPEESRLFTENSRGQNQNISNEDSREPFDLSQSRNSSQDKSPVEIKTEIPSTVNREPDNTHLKQEADDSMTTQEQSCTKWLLIRGF